MTENNSKYQRGKIYKIVSNITRDTYYGSTCSPLTQRLSEHRNKYKIYVNNKQIGYTTSFKVLETGDYGIYLVEDVPCDRKEQLLARERFYIESYDCVNKVIPQQSYDEYFEKYYEENKDEILTRNNKYRSEHRNEINLQKKEHYQLNKEHIQQKHKEYYDNNKESTLEYQRQYYLDNKEKVTMRNKAYQEKHKQDINAKRSIVISCVCGHTTTARHRSRHEKTKAHISFIESQK